MHFRNEVRVRCEKDEEGKGGEGPGRMIGGKWSFTVKTERAMG